MRVVLGYADAMLTHAVAGMMIIGDFASAYFTAVIAIHTFNSLVLRYKQPVWVNVAIVTVGWALAFAAGSYGCCCTCDVRS